MGLPSSVSHTSMQGIASEKRDIANDTISASVVDLLVAVCLFETHIRYSKDKIPKEERLELMKQVGHSDDVALSDYAQTYKPMVEWAESVEIHNGNPPLDGDGV